jgi:hypothetical protein
MHAGLQLNINLKFEQKTNNQQRTLKDNEMSRQETDIYMNEVYLAFNLQQP